MKKISLSLLPLYLSGCVMVGPDFKSPDAPQVDRFAGETATATTSTDETPRLVVGDTLPQQWWALYRSEALSQLVALGLENSPTLAAAQAKLKASQETINADTGAILYPNIDLALDSSRKRVSGIGESGNDNIFSVHGASLKLNYTIDPFGGGQRYLEYDQAVVDYDAFQLEAAKLTLAANIVTAALSEASLREQIAAMNAIITDEEGVLDVVEKQFVIGVIPKTELLSQRASLAQARTQLPALEKALAQTRHQLATLTGRLPPGVDSLPRIELDTLTLPHEIPVTLPSTLTRRRPDVRAAEEVLHQMSAQVGVAATALYPKLELNAHYGSETAKFSDLFSGGSAIWGIAAGLTQPIFHADELRAKKRVALANYDRAAALYRQQVLVAFQDVADALLALEMDGRQLALEKEAEKLAAETLALVRERYKHGAVSYLALLDAQRLFQQSRINLIKARTALYNDTAALMYALGGGWESVNTNAASTTKTSSENTGKNKI